MPTLSNGKEYTPTPYSFKPTIQKEIDTAAYAHIESFIGPPPGWQEDPEFREMYNETPKCRRQRLTSSMAYGALSSPYGDAQPTKAYTPRPHYLPSPRSRPGIGTPSRSILSPASNSNRKKRRVTFTADTGIVDADNVKRAITFGDDDEPPTGPVEVTSRTKTIVETSGDGSGMAVAHIEHITRWGPNPATLPGATQPTLPTEPKKEPEEQQTPPEQGSVHVAFPPASIHSSSSGDSLMDEMVRRSSYAESSHEKTGRSTDKHESTISSPSLPVSSIHSASSTSVDGHLDQPTLELKHGPNAAPIPDGFAPLPIGDDDDADKATKKDKTPSPNSNKTDSKLNATPKPGDSGLQTGGGSSREEDPRDITNQPTELVSASSNLLSPPPRKNDDEEFEYTDADSEEEEHRMEMEAETWKFGRKLREQKEEEKALMELPPGSSLRVQLDTLQKLREERGPTTYTMFEIMMENWQLASAVRDPAENCDTEAADLNVSIYHDEPVSSVLLPIISETILTKGPERRRKRKRVPSKRDEAKPKAAPVAACTSPRTPVKVATNTDQQNQGDAMKTDDNQGDDNDDDGAQHQERRLSYLPRPSRPSAGNRRSSYLLCASPPLRYFVSSPRREENSTPPADEKQAFDDTEQQPTQDLNNDGTGMDPIPHTDVPLLPAPTDHNPVNCGFGFDPPTVGLDTHPHHQEENCAPHADEKQEKEETILRRPSREQMPPPPPRRSTSRRVSINFQPEIQTLPLDCSTQEDKCGSTHRRLSLPPTTRVSSTRRSSLSKPSSVPPQDTQTLDTNPKDKEPADTASQPTTRALSPADSVAAAAEEQVSQHSGEHLHDTSSSGSSFAALVAKQQAEDKPEDDERLAESRDLLDDTNKLSQEQMPPPTKSRRSTLPRRSSGASVHPTDVGRSRRRSSVRLSSKVDVDDEFDISNIGPADDENEMSGRESLAPIEKNLASFHNKKRKLANALNNPPAPKSSASQKRRKTITGGDTKARASHSLRNGRNSH